MNRLILVIKILITEQKVNFFDNMEDIVYSDSKALGYGITLAAVPDTSGNTHYEYIKEA